MPNAYRLPLNALFFTPFALVYRMSFYADLHIHSKYSRATSRDCDLENLTYWGRKKGITVIGTGDFTHPVWFSEIQEKLIPAEPGLFKLKPDLEKKILDKLPSACAGTTRFMLSVEISTIYKKGDKVRKVHHLVYAPSIEQAGKIRQRLEKIGNIRSDGRPILGLDSRHLLEIVLEAGEGCFLVPAHIWTPWFAVLGSKSGFDRVADCYGDLADHVFALETGLSSDPEMNWRISHLDRYRLMSNSDAHSPQKLGREACVFSAPLDYFEMVKALKTGKGYGGTIEFFPEEGKYHLDGHRSCGIRFSPQESREHHGICPSCKKPLTLGVLYRVEELADRGEQERPAQTDAFQSIVPLPEVIAEIHQVGAASQKVARDYETLLNRLGSELDILNEAPLEEIKRHSSSLVAEAIDRMRNGQVIREGGYDGEYGKIRLFKDGELKKQESTGVLFDVPQAAAASDRDGGAFVSPAGGSVPPPSLLPQRAAARTVVSHSGLDEKQRQAVETTEGPLLILAGPGAGKTRTLTHRMAYLIQDKQIAPESCLAVTFTRRAAQEMRERLLCLVPNQAEKIPVTTFHGLAYTLLSEFRVEAGLDRGFRIMDEASKVSRLKKELHMPERKIEKILSQISLWKRQGRSSQPLDPDWDGILDKLQAFRDLEGLLDYDDLILKSVQLLEEDPDIRETLRRRFHYVSVDEYQDIDELQYSWIRLLVPPDGNLCAIGDPDQAIYSFRGASVEFFLRFAKDFPHAQTIRLTKNYRSGASILSASGQVIASGSLVEDRKFESMLSETGKVIIRESGSEKAEAEFIVETIEKQIGGTSFFSMDSGRSEGRPERVLTFSDFAVLYRMESQGDAIEQALIRSGIPYQRRNHDPLLRQEPVRDLIRSMEELREECPLAEAFERAKKFSDLEEPVLTQIQETLNASGGDWDHFFSHMVMTQSVDQMDPRAERVSLLTLHAAKGLEFGTVILAGCEEGILPLSWGGNISGQELAEERRLFYVGMTRAKDLLILSNARRRMWQGKLKEQTPSRFLKDIEEKLFDYQRGQVKIPRPKRQMELFSDKR